MDDRKFIPTHERLYSKGRQNLREKNLKDLVEKTQRTGRSESPIKPNTSPLRGMHRGKPTHNALYDLHPDLMRKKAEKIRLKEYEELVQKNTRFSNKESDEFNIEGFKKEFQQNLVNLLIREQRMRDVPDGQVDPKLHSLDFNHVAILMHQMGFLQTKLSTEQED